MQERSAANILVKKIYEVVSEEIGKRIIVLVLKEVTDHCVD